MGSSLFLCMYNSIVSVLYLSFPCFDNVSLSDNQGLRFRSSGLFLSLFSREASLADRGVPSFKDGWTISIW